MGTRMAPSYANLFMTSTESSFLESERLKPLVWKRFIDDIFIIWPHGRNLLTDFLDRLNNYSSLKFTHTISSEKITFLDVDLTLGSQNQIITSVHFKPTNKLQYLHYNSCHPPHIKQSIPYSLSLRGRRICNNEQTLHSYQHKIHKGLRKRDYPENFLQKHIYNRPRYHNNNTQHRNYTNQPKLITSYFEGSHKLKKLIRDTLPILTQNDETKNLLPKNPPICYRQNKNIKTLLTKTKPPPPLTNITPSGTLPCRRPRCKTCAIINTNILINTHHTTKALHTQPNTSCKTSNCIYLLECQHCPAFYVGETKNPLHIRINNHRHTCDSITNNTLPVPTHSRTHNSPFNQCFTVRILKSFHPPLTDVQLRTWESSFIWLLGAHFGPGLNKQH